MKIPKAVLNLSLFLFAAFVSLLAFEGSLAVFGFPKEAPESIAYPPNFYDETDFFGSPYVVKANSLGIRYPEIPLKKNGAGEIRVAVIGDSFTEGLGVKENQRFSSIMENRWSKPSRRVYFINCGVSGAGPREYLRIFYHIALRYHPDKLLVVLYANDLSDSRESLEYQRSGIKQWIHAVFPRVYARLKVFHYKLLVHKFRVFEEVLGSKAPISEPTSLREVSGTIRERSWHFMSNALSQIVRECRNKKIRVAVAYIPSYARQDAGDLELRLMQWSQKERIAFLNLAPYFEEAARRDPKPYYFREDIHWNTHGHALAASILSDWLKNIAWPGEID